MPLRMGPARPVLPLSPAQGEPMPVSWTLELTHLLRQKNHDVARARRGVEGRSAGRDSEYATAEPGPTEVVPRGRIQQISPPWTASPPPGHCNPGARIAQPGHTGRGGCQVIPPMSNIENPRRKPKVTRLMRRTTTNEHLSQFSDKSLRKSLSPRGRASPVRMTARREPAVLDAAFDTPSRPASPAPRPKRGESCPSGFRNSPDRAAPGDLSART